MALNIHGLKVIFWPSVQRVDARLDRVSLVIKEVTTIEIVQGIEVVFRRADGGRMFVTAAGQISMAV
jgi:hypothetical protein